jgi:hypothetical protein
MMKSPNANKNETGKNEESKMSPKPQWPNWGDHPAVVIIATVAASLAIVAFVLAPRAGGASAAAAQENGRDQVTNQASGTCTEAQARRVGEVRFKTPLPGNRVDLFTDVQPTFTGELEPGCQLVLLVRDPLGQYWSWSAIAQNEKRNVQIGGAGDRDQQFEIVAFVTHDVPPRGRPMTTLPNGLSVSSLTLTRR